jgi:hypothetical protein
VATRRKKLGLGCGGLLLLLVVLFLALPTRKILFPKHYDVVSIRALPETKDASRMERAKLRTYPSPIAYQKNGSLCGPTSLANVFASFGEESASAATVLAGSGKCSIGVCFMGLTLDELAELAQRRSGYHVTVLRDLSLAALREHLGHVGDPNRRYVLNFDRGPLFGTEGGHHSPIGGYLADDDLVLVLDVNAKYEPWLVKTERLFSAMDTIDEGASKKRGLLLVERTASTKGP